MPCDVRYYDQFESVKTSTWPDGDVPHSARIFLKLNFVIPTYDSAFPDALLTIEQQFVRALVYLLVA